VTATPTALNASRQKSASKLTATAVNAAATPIKRGRRTSASSVSTNRTIVGSTRCRAALGRTRAIRVSRLSARVRLHAASASRSAATATAASAESRSTSSGRLRRNLTTGRTARRTTAGRRSIALSIPTVASDRLTGIPFECRSRRLLASSPPRIGSTKLMNVAT
jgi:hypothetical protein